MPRDSQPQNDRGSSASRRRNFLRGLAATSALGLAGCTGGGGDGGGGGGDGDTPTETEGTDGADGGDGGTTQGQGTPRTVEFRFLASASDPQTKELYRNAFEGFSDQRDDVNINFSGEFLSMDAFMNKMNTYLGAGNPPDLAYGGGNLTTFTDQLEDLSSIMQQNNIPESLQLTFPGVGSPIHPVALEPNSRWYRTDVWDQAGIDFPEAEKAKTWSTHEQHMQQVMDAISGNKMASFYLSSEVVGAMLHCWHAYEVMSGVNYIRRTGDNLEDVEVSLADEKPGAVQYLKFGKKMYENFSPDTTGYGWNELVQLYVNQSVQQSMYPGRLLNNVIDQAPDLEDVTKFGYFEMPEENPAPENHLIKSGSLSFPDDYAAHVSINGFAVPSNAKNKDLSLDFLKWFFQTDYYAGAILAVPPHTVPANPDLLDEEPYASNEVWARHQDYKNFLQDYIPRLYPKVMGRTDPPSPYWNAITYASGIVPTMQQEVFLGRKSPEQAVDDAIPKLESKTEEVVQQFTG